MDIIKEGTHTYLLKQIAYKEQQTGINMLEYYLSVEYEILKHNSLKMLIPVQLREQDGRKSLLFDITEKRALKIRENSKGLSKKICKKILQSIISLIQEVEDYMLNLDCIEFLPEYIYEGVEGEIQWIYFPAIYMQNENEDNRETNLQNKIESLFEWMLMQIDYEDNSAVRFIYGIYNNVRKRGFSKEMLERYLCSEEKNEYKENSYKESNYKESRYEENSYANNEYKSEEYDQARYKQSQYPGIEYNEEAEYKENISYEEFFKEDLEAEDRERKVFSQNTGKQEERNNRKGNKKNKEMLYVCLKVIFLVLLLASAGLEGVWVFGGMTKGFTEVLFQYCIGGVFLIIAFTLGMFVCSGQIRKIKNAGENDGRITNNQIRKNSQKNNNPILNSGQELTNNQMLDSSQRITNNQRINNSLKISRPLTIKTDAEWEIDKEEITNNEGTTILNSNGINCERGYMDEHPKEVYPMLRDMETGIVYIIKSYPFYIGSAEGVNQLTISDKTVSREHAVILEKLYEQGEEGYILRDLDSTNGTWIDGKRMKSGSQRELQDGATIYFAKKAYKFLLA